MKFVDFADEYLENYAKTNKVERSWKTDGYFLKGMKEFFRDFYMDEVTPLDVEKLKAEKLKQGERTSAVNRYLAILSKMFNLAVDWEVLQRNQIFKIKRFSEKDNLQERILTHDEEERLLDSCSAHLKPIVVVALDTGMRRGEILGLHWDRIDLVKRIIRVEKTKNKKIRIIPINDVLFKELVELKCRTGKSEHPFVNPRTGEPLKEVKTAFNAAKRRAGIQNLRFHDLRHTFASRLIARGADPITVKELLGHSSVKTTERYTLSFKEQKVKAVETLVEKTLNDSKKAENLLHICDTESREGKQSALNLYFSVN